MITNDTKETFEKRRLRLEKRGKGVSLPRERFWDILVTKIDSPTRQPLLPRPPCVRAAPPHHRKLGAGSAALPQWLDGVSDALAYALRRLRDLRPLRHSDHTPAPTPTGDYPPRASHFHGGQRSFGNTGLPLKGHIDDERFFPFYKNPAGLWVCGQQGCCPHIHSLGRWTLWVTA